MDLEATELAPDVAAGFGLRFAARALDALAAFGAGVIGTIPAWLVLSSLETARKIAPGWQARVSGAFLATVAWSVVGMFLYHSVAEGFGGASFGKLVLGLRVVNERGAPCEITAAVVRSAAYLLDAQLFGLVCYGRMKRSPLAQRFGDTWAHTVVARSRMLPRSSRRSSTMIALSLGIGLVLWATCVAVGTIAVGV